MKKSLDELTGLLPGRIRRLASSEEGFIFPYFALVLVVMLGAAGLALDVGRAYSIYQQMQSAADAAAFSGELALLAAGSSGSSSTNSNIVTEGRAVAASSGFVHGTNNVAVNVYTGSQILAPSAYQNDTNSVQAVISQPLTTSFIKIFGINTLNIEARATASHNAMQFCVLALKSNATPGFSMQGNISAGTPNCGIADNSTDTSNSAHLQGSGTISGPLAASGAIQQTGQSFNIAYHVPPYPQAYAPATPDPYAQPPTPNANSWVNSFNPWSGAGATNVPKNSNFTMSGGGALGTINTSKGAITLQNGVYTVNATGGSSINLSGTATLTTTNATLVVQGDVNFGTNTVSLTAPTANSAGATNKGIAITSPFGINLQSQGNSNLSLLGALYLPNTTSTISLGGGASSCAQIIAGSITLNGNVAFNNDNSCGTTSISTNGSAKLVE